MATGFSENEQLRICRVMGVSNLELASTLTFYDTQITAEVESQVRELLDEWDTNNVSRKTTQIKAMEANFGAEINPGELRSLIKKELAVLLYLPANTNNRLERC
jgi:hypothetical protein